MCGVRKIVVGNMQPSIKQLPKSFFLVFCLVDLRICFCLNRAKLSLGWTQVLSSIDTVGDLSRKHWQDSIIFEFIKFLKSFIEYLCLKFLAHLLKWRAEPGAWEVFFFFCCSIENSLFFFQFFSRYILEQYIFELSMRTQQ